MSKRFVAVGECMVEMSGGEDRQYRLGYAGDTLNTAWYARALLPEGWSVDYVTAVGDDRYSEEMVAFIADAGIGTASMRRIAGKRPGLYLIHQEKGDRKFTYWRDSSAARLLADDGPALNAALGGADIVYFSGITMAILDPRARGRMLNAIVAAREAGALVAFDPNIRPALWSSDDVMRSVITSAATISDIVLPTHSDEAPVFGDTDVEGTAKRYLALGVREVAVKDGGNPALIATADETVLVAPRPDARIIDPTGAGDSFNGSYLSSRMKGLGLGESATAAHATAAAVVGHKGALVDRNLLKLD